MRRITYLSLFLGLMPLAWLIAALLGESLGSNPVETLSHTTGDWALRFLLLSLSATPARRWLALGWPLRLRRQWGLFAFFYATLHLLIYLILDHELNIVAIVDDLLERPYITFGMLALLLLLPLAATSTTNWQRRLGRRWRLLHRLVYPAAMAVIVHYFLLVKADALAPLLHALLLALLLGSRLVPHSRATP